MKKEQAKTDLENQREVQTSASETIKTNCALCSFQNPKGTATGVILRDNKLLVLKRNEEPFRGMWDLPGGYMNKAEIPARTIEREIKEELGIGPKEITLMQVVPGMGLWEDTSFPIVSFFFLVDIGDQELKLNEENSEYKWIPLHELEPDNIAWDSNQEFCAWLKDRFTFNLTRVKELIRQLDSSANAREQSLYKAILQGFIATEYDGDKLIGMGWIFPRQTLLRHQAVVEDMIIDETYRGKGLGRKILIRLLEWAKNNGVQVVELTTNPNRVAANGLYKSVGFWLHSTNHYLYNVEKEK